MFLLFVGGHLKQFLIFSTLNIVLYSYKICFILLTFTTARSLVFNAMFEHEMEERKQVRSLLLSCILKLEINMEKV